MPTGWLELLSIKVFSNKNTIEPESTTQSMSKPPSFAWTVGVPPTISNRVGHVVPGVVVSLSGLSGLGRVGWSTSHRT